MRSLCLEKQRAIFSSMVMIASKVFVFQTIVSALLALRAYAPSGVNDINEGVSLCP